MRRWAVGFRGFRRSRLGFVTACLSTVRAFLLEFGEVFALGVFFFFGRGGGLGCGDQDSWFRVQGLGFRVQGSGFRV